MTLQAIETQYKGYRFRSRLEARWAVFMDTLGIEYRYEPEGFELGDGIRYLPDFWLPKLGVWLEIKPDLRATMDRDQKGVCIRQAHRLASASFKPVCLSFGDLSADGHLLCWFVPNKGDSYLAAFWAECRGCGCIGLAVGDETEEADIACACVGAGSDPLSSRLVAAYEAGRSARFEHGESGAPALVAPTDEAPSDEDSEQIAWGHAVADQRLLHLLTTHINHTLDQRLTGEQFLDNDHFWRDEISILAALLLRRRELEKKIEAWRPKR